MLKNITKIFLYLIITMFFAISNGAERKQGEYSFSIRDHQFSLAGGRRAGENKDFTLKGDLILNAKNHWGLVLQGAGTVRLDSWGSQLGFSGGLGYEPRGVGYFVFADGLFYKEGDFLGTFHFQLRPTIRFQSRGLRGTFFYALGFGDNYTGVDKLRKVEYKISYYNKSLSYFGAILETLLLKGSYMKIEAIYAPGNIYKLLVEKELHLWGGLNLLAHYRVADFGPYPNLALQGFSKGSSFSLGLRYRFGSMNSPRNIRERTIVPVFYPLVASYEKEIATNHPVKEDTPEEVPLTVTLKGEPLLGQSPLSVDFTALTDGGKGPFTFYWFFPGEDEETITASNEESHTFYREGSHEVYLEVLDSLGNKASSNTLHIEVNDNGTYNIRAQAHKGALITPSGTVIARKGGSYSFKITAKEGYKIQRVEIDGENKGALSDYCFKQVGEDHKIEAWGKLDDGLEQFQILSLAGPGGGNDPQGTLVVDEGGSKKIRIHPQEGYAIADILVDGSSLGAREEYDFNNVKENHTIQSHFQASRFTITAIQNPGGTISPPGITTVEKGENLTYSMANEPGHELTGILIDGLQVSLTGELSYTFKNIRANHTIEPLFGQQTLTVTATMEGEGTLVDSGSVQVVYGDSRSFIFTPKQGWELSRLLVDDKEIALPGDGRYTFASVTKDHTIHGVFSKKSYKITVLNGKGGYIEPGSSIVPWGESISFKIFPLESHEINDVKIDGGSWGPVTNHTFENVDCPHTLEGLFKIKTFTISVDLDSGSQCSPGTTQVTYGQNREFLFSAKEGFRVTHVVIDGISRGEITAWRFTNITAHHQIEVHSQKQEFTISETHETGALVRIMDTLNPGTIQVPWDSRVNCVFDTVSTSGKEIENVTIDGTSLGKISSWTFENVRENHKIDVETQWKYYCIKASAGPGGNISPQGDQWLRQGNDISFTIRPNDGYLLESLRVDGNSVNPALNYVFKDVQKDHEIHCTFKKAPLPKFQVLYGAYDFSWKDNSLVPNQGTGGGGPEIQEEVRQGELFQFAYPASVKDPSLPTDRQFEIPFLYLEINGKRQDSRLISITITADTTIHAFYHMDRNI